MLQFIIIIYFFSTKIISNNLFISQNNIQYNFFIVTLYFQNSTITI